MTRDIRPGTLTVRVPFRLSKRGGRKEVLLPNDVTLPPRTDRTLVKALARAFRWKRMLDAGEVATISDLAKREKIPASYLTRLMRLTLLAPDVVEAILAGEQDRSLMAEALRGEIPNHWEMQRRICGTRSRPAGAATASIEPAQPCSEDQGKFR